jgi:phage terminase large subunit-like protein
MPKIKSSGGINDNLFREVISGYIAQDGRVVSITDFAESHWGLNLTLTPVQKFVLKAFYGLPLDGENKTIEIPDKFNAKIIEGPITEIEFAQWSYDTGRCNINLADPANAGRRFYELQLAFGRRSGKTLICAVVVDYEFYRLIKLRDPHSHYKFPPGQEIAVVGSGPTDEQAGLVFNDSQVFALNSPILRERIAHPTMTYFEVQTDNDVKQYGLGKKGSMTFYTGGSSSKSVRGHNAIAVIIDEMAHFIENNGRFSIDEMHGALIPSIANFKDPVTGNQEGKALFVSSPYAHYGKFYQLYRDAFSEDGQKNGHRLVFRYHTALVNPPRVSEDFLRDQFRQDRARFRREFEAEFDERITCWVDNEVQFKSNIRRPYRPEGGKPNTTYFWGFDLGVTDNGTAVSVVHRDEVGRYKLDFAEVWYSNSSPVWEASLCTLYKEHKECARWRNCDALNLFEIAQYIAYLEKTFPMYRGVIDQFSGHAFYQILTGLELTAVEMSSVNESIKCQMYQVVKDLYTEGLLDLMDHPILVPEMLSLEAELRAHDRIMVSKRESTDGSFQDDITDAYVRALWLCWQHYNVLAGPNAKSGIPAVVSFGNGIVIGAQQSLRQRLQHAHSFQEYSRLKMTAHGEVASRPRSPAKLAKGRLR